MKRTTLFVDEAILLELKGEAEREGRPMAALVREALEAYLADSRTKQRFPFVGLFTSEQGNLREGVDSVIGQALLADYERQQREYAEDRQHDPSKAQS